MSGGAVAKGRGSDRGRTTHTALQGLSDLVACTLHSPHLVMASFRVWVGKTAVDNINLLHLEQCLSV